MSRCADGYDLLAQVKVNCVWNKILSIKLENLLLKKADFNQLASLIFLSRVFHKAYMNWSTKEGFDFVQKG